MERHEELSNRFCQLQSEVNALTREMGEINEEWASEGLKELGLKVGQVIKDGDDSYIVESRYGSASAMAREAVDKKGMDDAQITGATNSYARKYCLNGLFGIDDSKDADTDEHKNQQSAARPQSASQRVPATPSQAKCTPEQLLAAFTEYAMKSTLADLEKAWGSADRNLKGTEQHGKALSVYLDRKSELEGVPA